MAYQDLPKTEDREELLASSDTDVASMAEENQWATSSEIRTGRWAKGRPFLSALRECAWLITMGLLAVAIVLQLAIWHELRKISAAADSSAQPGGDHTGKGPLCSSPSTNSKNSHARCIGPVTDSCIVPTEVIKWNPDPEFVPLNATEFLNPKVQEKWESLYPGMCASITVPVAQHLVYAC